MHLLPSNPTTGDRALPAGTLCTAMKKPRCAHWEQASDTMCTTLENQRSIPWQQFFSYNDDVNNNCTNLVM